MKAVGGHLDLEGGSKEVASDEAKEIGSTGTGTFMENSPKLPVKTKHHPSKKRPGKRHRGGAAKASRGSKGRVRLSASDLEIITQDKVYI